MALVQSIELARADTIGRTASSPRFDAALKRTQDALDWLRARHADGSLPLLRLPERARRPRHHPTAARRCCATARATSSFSAPAARASAARRWRSSPATPCPASARCATRRACISWTISTRQTFGDAAGNGCRSHDHALRRDLEIRRHRRDADADHRRRSPRSSAPGCEPACPSCCSASPSRRRPASATACAICSPAHGVPMLDHDTGVGGRFSVLTNVGLLPAAVAGLDIAAIRAGAADALAPVLAEQAAGRRAGRGRRRAVDRARRAGQADHRDDGLCRPAGAVHALVRAALGRKPRQGRQGHDAAGGARPGRPAQPAAALHRRPARQAVHGRSPSARRAAARAWRPTWPSSRGEPRLRRQDHRRPGRGAGPRHRRDAGQERLPGAHHPHRPARRAPRSANC